jgi:uncharacterized membrane-anchored protein
MSRKGVLVALVLAVVFQVSVLATEYLTSVYPLWTGQEIRLKTVPVDPRSLFRGNYVRLNYEISSIPKEAFHDIEPRQNEVVYVSLKRNEQGLYVYNGVSLHEPESGLFLRGRIDDGFAWRGNYRIRYGIEAYFLKRDQARQMERDLSDGGVAVVMLSGSGKAALKEVVP